MIVYTCICRAADVVILAESLSPELDGNAHEVMGLAIDELKTLGDTVCPPETRKTFSQKQHDDFFGEMVSSWTGGYVHMDTTDHYFHFWLSKKGIYYACISDDAGYREQAV